MRRRFVLRFVFVLGLFLVAVVAVNVLVFHGVDGGHRGRFVPFGVVFLLIVGGVALIRGVRGFARPVGDVMEAADRVAEGDYAARVPERGPREIRRLGRSFNQMAERLQTSEERRRNLLADVTHELRTPLAVMQANLEGLMDGVYPTDTAHLALILDETKMMSRLLDDLQTLSTAEAGALRLHRESVEPGALVDEAVAGFRAAADPRRSPADRRGLHQPALERRATYAARRIGRGGGLRRRGPFGRVHGLGHGSRDPGGGAGPRVRPVREGLRLPRSGPGSGDREELDPRARRPDRRDEPARAWDHGAVHPPDHGSRSTRERLSFRHSVDVGAYGSP
jgi:signal transduction histidine kinase